MSIRRVNLQPLRAALDRGATLLVPNRRLRDAVVSQLLQASAGSVLLTPQVFAIDVWLKNQWQTLAAQAREPFCRQRLLSPVDEHFLWSAIVEQTLERWPLLNPEQVADLCARSYQSLQQWVPAAQAQQALHAYPGVADIAAFNSWRSRFQQHCQEQQLISLVDAIEVLIEQLGNDPELLGRPDLVLVNFLRPPPLYQRLFDSLPGASRIDTVQAPDATAVAGGPATSCRHEFSDARSEARACVHWAQQLATTQPDCHVGIIANLDRPQWQDLERQLEEALDPLALVTMGSSGGGVNSAGSAQTLLDLALVHDGLALLGLVEDSQLSNEICRLLRSPFLLAAAEEREARIQMELFMRRRFSSRCSIRQVSFRLGQEDRPWSCPRLAQALLQFRTIQRETDRHMSAARWADCFQRLLEVMGWPGAEAAAAQAGLLQQWQETLKDFSQAAAALGPLEVGAAIAHLRQACALRTLVRPFYPAANISCYSLDEALGLEFDHVWLLGFHDQAWPPAETPSPFLPFALQRQFQMPGSDSQRQHELAGQDFQLLLGSVSTSLVASHHQFAQEQELRPSYYCLQFPLQAAAPVPAPFNALAGVLPAPAALLQVQDRQAPQLQASELVGGGQSLLSHQSACPFQGFARHRLLAEPLRQFTAGLSPMARGTAIHIALQALFEGIPSSEELGRMTPAARASACRAAADQAIDYLKRNHRELMSPAFSAIELERISALLLKFLDRESGREPFQVLAREQKSRWHWQDLELTLKIDRVDRMADGGLAVIDYKTGKPGATAKQLLEARPEDLQLALYYCVVTESQPEPVQALFLAHLNVEETGYRGLAASSSFHPRHQPTSEDPKVAADWQTLGQSWQDKVRRTAEEFSAGHCAVNPANGPVTCKRCGMQALCRIQEARGSDADLNEEDVAP